MESDQKQHFLDKLEAATNTAKLQAALQIKRSLITDLMGYQHLLLLKDKTSKTQIKDLTNQLEAADKLILNVLDLFPSAQRESLIDRLTDI